MYVPSYTVLKSEHISLNSPEDVDEQLRDVGLCKERFSIDDDLHARLARNLLVVLVQLERDEANE